MCPLVFINGHTNTSAPYRLVFLATELMYKNKRLLDSSLHSSACLHAWEWAAAAECNQMWKVWPEHV